MNKSFRIKKINPNASELSKIGFDKTYVKKGLEKHEFETVKIYGLTPAQGNILKQTALITGTDCAVHRETITGKIDHSDCILSGSLSQFRKIAQKLQNQPFKLFELGKELEASLFEPLGTLKIRNRLFEWEKQTYIMGIVNVTPDSFSDGGEYLETENAAQHAFSLINEGADIIDIGGESTRPYAQETSVDEEISRVIPLIETIREKNKKIIISIDTRNAKTAKAALKAGADIINDVSACDWDKEMTDVVKTFNCPIILNHSKGTPKEMQENTTYIDAADEVYEYLEKKIDVLCDLGIEKRNLIVDPGIGFGKNTEQNYELIKKIKEFKSLGCALLAGHSRKTFLQKTLNTKENEILDIGTNAVSAFLIKEKVNILRVHNVKNLKILTEIYKNL